MDVKIFKVFHNKSFIKKEDYYFFWDVMPNRQILEERRRIFEEWMREARERIVRRSRQG